MPFLGSALAFDILLATVPFILLLVAVLAWMAQTGPGGEADLAGLFERFFPPHASGSPGPFSQAEALLTSVGAVAQQLTLVALPTFIWFSTRAFASVRTSLSEIFDLSVRPTPRRNILAAFARGKLRDLTMVFATLLLFVLSTAISAGLALARAWGDALGPRLSFLVSTFWGIGGQVLAFGFIVLLFFLLYRHGSPRVVKWRGALVASLFAGVAFEIARRLYAFYVTNVAAWSRATADASLGAAILFVIWVYYSAVVFLLGAVVAETWELRRLQQHQRAVLK